MDILVMINGFCRLYLKKDCITDLKNSQEVQAAIFWSNMNILIVPLPVLPGINDSISCFKKIN